MTGESLIEFVIDLSGLPKDYARGQLHSLLTKHEINPSTASLDDLRIVLADFLQEAVLEI